jgi:hypothetical protein
VPQEKTATRKQVLGNRALKLSTMKKSGNRTGGGSKMKAPAEPGLGHGGSPKIGRTLAVKGHPTHPSLAFAAPHGSKKGSKSVAPGKLVAAHTKRPVKK